MIDIRQLRYFVVLAETLHFGRAAERLNLTQPPLSRQIAALEQDLGVRLLERHSRGAALTAAGRRFLEDAKVALAAFDLACRNARLTERGEMGELAVGFMMHAGYTVMPPLARRFIDAHPQVDLTLREVAPGPLVDDVLAGRFDAGVLFDPGPTPGLAIRVIYREPLCLAVHQRRALAAGTGPVSPADLEGLPLIATSARSAPTLRQATEAWLRSGRAAPSIRLEAELQHTIVNLVAEDLGLALAPRPMSRLGVPGVAFRDLKDPPLVDYVAAWRPDNRNPALAPFLAILPEAEG